MAFDTLSLNYHRVTPDHRGRWSLVEVVSAEESGWRLVAGLGENLWRAADNLEKWPWVWQVKCMSSDYLKKQEMCVGLTVSVGRADENTRTGREERAATSDHAHKNNACHSGGFLWKDFPRLCSLKHSRLTVLTSLKALSYSMEA